VTAGERLNEANLRAMRKAGLSEDQARRTLATARIASVTQRKAAAWPLERLEELERRIAEMEPKL
jgi:hypothetical protein